MNMNKPELIAMARLKGVPGYSTMNKEQLRVFLGLSKGAKKK